MRTLALTTWRPIGVALLWMCAATFLVGCTTSGFSATPDEARGWTVPRWLTEDRRSPAEMAALCALSWFSCGNSVKYVTFSTQQECEAFRGAHPTYTKPDEVCRQVYGHDGKTSAFGPATDR